MSNLFPRPKKHWGQNFFCDVELLSAALEPLELGSEDVVLEIGPGRGILTQLLLEQVSEVLALEIDPELCQLLSRQFAEQTHLHLLNQDFLDYDLSRFHADLPLARRKLIANIPYHLTSVILMKILNEEVFRQGITPATPFFSDICLMVQKEVAEKLLAAPGSKAYNALSATVSYAAAVEHLSDLPRELFDPPPNVDSALIRLRPYTVPPVSISDMGVFWQLLSRIYQLRRKNLRNVLRSLGLSPEAADQLSVSLGLDLARRGETLSLTELAALANGIAG